MSPAGQVSGSLVVSSPARVILSQIRLADLTDADRYTTRRTP